MSELSRTRKRILVYYSRPCNTHTCIHLSLPPWSTSHIVDQGNQGNPYSVNHCFPQRQQKNDFLLKGHIYRNSQITLWRWFCLKGNPCLSFLVDYSPTCYAYYLLFVLYINKTQSLPSRWLNQHDNDYSRWIRATGSIGINM